MPTVPARPDPPAPPAGAARFARRGRSTTTFKGSLAQPIHRWFTITPAYAPELVADCADHLGAGPAERYLDPFSGSGTTAVWCRTTARPCTAVEWNPALHFVSRVKAGWRSAPDALLAAGTAFVDAWAREAPAPGEARAYLAARAAWVPGISHPERWWAPDALASLTAARVTLAAHPPSDDARPGIALALMGILIEVSRARYSHASITFSAGERVLPATAARDAFARRLALIAEDLRALAGRPDLPATVLRGNALALGAVVPEPGTYTRLICSPPYPNRYSYARETRPHLFFLDLVADARAVGELDHAAMGGTWGRATSALAREHHPSAPAVAAVMAPLLPALRAAHPLMANYAVRYFNDFWQHIAALDGVMAPRARLAYVVGNSKLGGVEVPVTDWLLALFAAAGWRPIGPGLHHMRRRNSRPGLVESVLFLER
jgi:hypothetical protein